MKQSKRIMGRRRGFTLLEVLMVVVILGILAAVVVPNLFQGQAIAEIGAAKSSMKGIESALNLYRIAMGAYPEELRQLVEAPDDEEEARKWGKDGYIEEKNLVDPWGEEWYYRGPEDAEENAGKFDLGSNGPDKEWGTEDDLKNWEED